MYFRLANIFLAVIFQVRAVTYYVTPDSGSCSNSLEPCHQLYQLNSTLLGNLNALSLRFLPGVHILPDSNTFTLHDINELELVSNDTLNKSDIRCHGDGYLLFQSVEMLKVAYLKFVSCTLKILPPRIYNGMPHTVYIHDCVLTNSNNHSMIIEYMGMGYVLIKNCSIAHCNGGLSCLSCVRTEVDILDSVFQDNLMEGGKGSAVYVDRSKVRIENCRFIRNTAMSGGAIYSKQSTLFINNSVFIDNYSRKDGGGIYADFTSLSIHNCLFQRNRAANSGGGLVIDFVFPSDFTVGLNNVTFLLNEAKANGGALYCSNHVYSGGVIITGYAKLNLANNGGFAYLVNCPCQIDDRFDMINNTAIQNGGAVYARNTQLLFRGTFFNISFNSAAHRGGAMYLETPFIPAQVTLITLQRLIRTGSSIRIASTSPLNRDEYATLLFYNNVVTSKSGKGGAIHVADGNCENPDIIFPSSMCFLYEHTINAINYKHFVFINNKASFGSVLYGGLLDRCIPPLNTSFLVSGKAWSGIDAFRANSYYTPPLVISSQPMKVCLCLADGSPDCTNRGINTTVIKGAAISLAVIAVDQNRNPIPATILATYDELFVHLGRGEDSRAIPGRCTTLEYHLFTSQLLVQYWFLILLVLVGNLHSQLSMSTSRLEDVQEDLKNTWMIAFVTEDYYNLI